MAENKVIKAGDLVTLSLGEYSSVSNTYIVDRKLENECILSHPLAPECLIIRSDLELNQSFPILQNGLEKCLAFTKKNKAFLSYSMASDLDALCYFFVIKKSISTKQRHDLANMCGKIASEVLGNNFLSATSLIKENKALLDDFHSVLFNNHKEIIDDPSKIKIKNDKFVIFNIAGFILAQLKNS